MRLYKYRIVTDAFCGYECQEKLFFLPFWLQCDFSNTWTTLEDAKNFIERIKKRRESKKVIWSD